MYKNIGGACELRCFFICLWYNKDMAAAMVPAVSVESTRVSPGFPICSSHNYSNASMPRCKMVTLTSAK